MTELHAVAKDDETEAPEEGAPVSEPTKDKFLEGPPPEARVVRVAPTFSRPQVRAHAVCECGTAHTLCACRGANHAKAIGILAMKGEVIVPCPCGARVAIQQNLVVSPGRGM